KSVLSTQYSVLSTQYSAASGVATMSKRCLRADLAACGLLFAGMLVALSIFSFDPADPPGPAVHPPNRMIANLLGPAGAWLARTMLETLGVAVTVFLASWFVLVVLLFLRRGL